MSSVKYENRALTRTQVELLIHTVVAYAAKHRRRHWKQLSDAGHPQVILQTDTNLAPAIGRQARCHRILHGGLDLPNNEPQFYFQLKSPVCILQTPFGYNRNGGSDMDHTDKPSMFCCCRKSSNGPRVCLITLTLTSLDKFRSVNQLPQTDLIQMLQMLEQEEIEKAQVKKGWTGGGGGSKSTSNKKKDGTNKEEEEIKFSDLQPPPPPLATSELPHLLRLYFSFAKEQIYTIETLGQMSIDQLNELKIKIPGFHGRRHRIIMKRVRFIMDERIRNAELMEEERLKQEIIEEALKAAKEAEKMLKQQEEEREKTQEREQEEKEEKEEEDKEEGKEEEEEGKEEEEEGNGGSGSVLHGTAKETAKEKELEKENENEGKKEQQKETKEQEELIDQTDKVGEKGEEGEEGQGEQKDKEVLLTSDPILTAIIYKNIDIKTTRTVDALYLSREAVDEERLFLNPNERGKLISIYEKQGREMLLLYLLKALYHLCYEDVVDELNLILEQNVNNIDSEIENYDDDRYILSKRSYIWLGSYCLNEQWHLVIDFKTSGPFGSSSTATTGSDSHNSSSSSSSSSASVLNCIKKKRHGKVQPYYGKLDHGQVGNYSPNETRQLFIDLMLEATLMKERFKRCFVLREIKHLRINFLLWRKNIGPTKSKRKKYDAIGSTSKRNTLTTMEQRKRIAHLYPNTKNKYRYLYQMILGLNAISKMHSEHLKLTVEGQLKIGEASEDIDTVEAAADASSENAPEPLDIYLFQRLKSEVHLGQADTIHCLTNAGIVLPVVVQSTVWKPKDTMMSTGCKDCCSSFWCGLFHCVPCFAPCYMFGCCEAYIDKDRKSGEKGMNKLIREQLNRNRTNQMIRVKREEICEERRRVQLALNSKM